MTKLGAIAPTAIFDIGQRDFLRLGKQFHDIGVGVAVTKVDLVIFDCDGVLVDSEGISASVLITQLAAQGVVIDADYVREHFLGRSFPTVAAHVRQRSGVSLPDSFEANYLAELLERFESELECTAGVEEVLARLSRPFCVATSSSPARIRRTLALTGLDHWFGPRVFTASEVDRGKPAPDLFLHVARHMSARPEHVLVIEDSVPGIVAAERAGMRVIVYAGGSHMKDNVQTPGGPPLIESWKDFPKDLLSDAPLEMKA